MIETVDVCRRQHRSRTKGRMNTTGHETILGILVRRARSFCPDMRLVQEHEQMNGRIDETGTLHAEEEVVDDERALAARVVMAREIRTREMRCWKYMEPGHHPSQRE